MAIPTKYITWIETIEESKIIGNYDGNTNSFIMENGRVATLIIGKSKQSSFYQITSDVLKEIEQNNGAFYLIHENGENVVMFHCEFENMVIYLNKDNRFLIHVMEEDGYLNHDVNKITIFGNRKDEIVCTMHMVCDNGLFKTKVIEEKIEKKSITEKQNIDKSGVVYCLVNPSFKENWIKIGRTINMEERLRSLNNTSVPLPFEVFSIIKTSDMFSMEQFVHEEFTEKRINEKREYFNIEPNEVTKLFIRLSKLIDGSQVFVYENGLEKKIYG